MKLVTVAPPRLPAFSVAPEDIARRDSLLDQSRAVAAITDAVTQNSAVDIGRQLRTLEKEVEEVRQQLTKPLLDAQRSLKAVADEYCRPLAEERKRLEKLVAEFQAEERRRVAEEELRRAEEIARREQERLEAEKAAQQAATADVDAAIAAARVAEEAQEAARAAIVAPLPEVTKAKGAATRKVLRWEVVDLAALYAARPDLCKLEPKPSAIQATCVPEMPVPGLRLWWEEVAVIRGF